jgi:hypothetical protein
MANYRRYQLDIAGIMMVGFDDVCATDEAPCTGATRRANSNAEADIWIGTRQVALIAAAQTAIAVSQHAASINVPPMAG